MAISEVYSEIIKVGDMIKNNPLISIIVPVYNTEGYLRECLDSILQQTYNNIEAIIVDDGSTDRSADVCREYSNIDSRIKYINKKMGACLLLVIGVLKRLKVSIFHS